MDTAVMKGRPADLESCVYPPSAGKTGKEHGFILIPGWSSSFYSFYFVIDNQGAFGGHRPLLSHSGPELGPQPSTSYQVRVAEIKLV